MRLLTCSNSCPRWDAGVLVPRSPGGLIPMLNALLTQHGGHWVFTAAPGIEGSDPVELAGGVWLHPMDLPEQIRSQHYDTISIGLLLGLLHYLHDTSAQPIVDGAALEAWAGYEAVNRAYAKRLAELVENTPDELILLNDPHLMLVPEFLSPQIRGGTRLTYFLGTPWCEPDYFSILPGWMRGRILESLLRCDVVGFHASRWADAFVACCARYLRDVRVERSTVDYRGHRTRMVAKPFPLDVAALGQMRDEPATARWAQRLSEMAGGRPTIVRADRLDLWKNLPRGFAAYEAMLERQPDWADNAWHAAIVTVPSRATDRHRAYQEQTEALVRRINQRFGGRRGEAVSLIYPGSSGDSRNSVVASLDLATAAFVNSTFDGLNLFAKEAALLMADPASLLLSVNAGVHEQLGAFATPVDPFDLEQTSRAMEAALDGTVNGQAGAAARRDLLRRESVTDWLSAIS
jgi:trehalose 6-phosphate synthase